MNFRLVQLQEDIVKSYSNVAETVQNKAGKGNDAKGKSKYMQTLQQLIDGEGTLQGKIQRMMSIAEQMEIVRHEDFLETIDSFAEENAV